jgi:hypothetical protein
MLNILDSEKEILSNVDSISAIMRVNKEAKVYFTDETSLILNTPYDEAKEIFNLARLNKEVPGLRFKLN